MQPFKRPSLLHIIQTDYWSLMAVFFSIVFWIFFIAQLLLGDIGARGFLWIALAVTVVALPFLLWRYYQFRTVFERGQEAPGTISNLSFYRGRGQVEYTYTYQDQKYTSSIGVYRSKRAKALKTGERVKVVVDPDHPERAYIRDLYL